MPASVRRTGNPSPSKPVGPVEIASTGRSVSPSPAALTRGRTSVSAETAAITITLLKTVADATALGTSPPGRLFLKTPPPERTRHAALRQGTHRALRGDRRGRGVRLGERDDDPVAAHEGPQVRPRLHPRADLPGARRRLSGRGVQGWRARAAGVVPQPAGRAEGDRADQGRKVHRAGPGGHAGREAEDVEADGRGLARL